MADFLDRLKQGVSKGVTTVSVKSKEVLEVSKLRSQISDLQKQKRDALEELGSITHLMILKSDVDQERLRGKSFAITSLDEEITKKESEIAAIHAKTQEDLGRPKVIAICVCGAQVVEGSKFCGKCGKSVELQ